MPGEMRLVSPVVEIEHVDLIERIARLALALEHEALAVGRPVALAGASAFDGEPADAREESRSWKVGWAAWNSGPAMSAASMKRKTIWSHIITRSVSEYERHAPSRPASPAST